MTIYNVKNKTFLHKNKFNKTMVNENKLLKNSIIKKDKNSKDLSKTSNSNNNKENNNNNTANKKKAIDNNSNNNNTKNDNNNSKNYFYKILKNKTKIKIEFINPIIPQSLIEEDKPVLKKNKII